MDSKIHTNQIKIYLNRSKHLLLGKYCLIKYKPTIMSLFNQSLIIFCTIFSLIILLVIYPTPHTLFFAMMFGSVLALYQAYIILVDKTENVEATDEK